MSSIPSSAMPHAKAHDDEDQPDAAATPDGEAARATFAGAKDKAAEVQDKVSDEAASLTRRVRAEAREHPNTGMAIGAVVALGVAALAALPFFLSRSDAKPKPRKAKPKPKARKSA